MTDQLRAAIKGDSSAYAPLVTPYFSDLRRLLRSKLGGLPDIDREEVLQDILIKVWRALPKYLDKYPFRSFVFGIALMHIRKVLSNRSHRREIPVSEMEFSTDDAPSPSDTIDRLLQRATAAPPRHIPDPDPGSDAVLRETLTSMLGYGGYPHQQIAFGFSILLWGQAKQAKTTGPRSRVPVTGNPLKVTQEMRDALLRSAGEEFQAELKTATSLRAEEMDEAFHPFWYRLGLIGRDLFARDATSQRQFSAVLDRIAGETSLGFYFGKDPAKSVMDWTNAVKLRTQKALRGELTQKNSPLPWPEDTRDAGTQG
jgi:DNA-directed RNA polymerase specialized sigma24 family protein